MLSEESKQCIVPGYTKSKLKDELHYCCCLSTTLIGLCKTKLTKLYLDGRRAKGDMMEEVLRRTRANKHPAQISGLSRRDLF